jgi:hypothetical protein
MHPCIPQNNIQRTPNAQFVCYNVLKPSYKETREHEEKHKFDTQPNWTSPMQGIIPHYSFKMKVCK